MILEYSGTYCSAAFRKNCNTYNSTNAYQVLAGTINNMEHWSNSWYWPTILLIAIIVSNVIRNTFFHPLTSFPGPLLARSSIV
jgi:hypothetical protein